MAMILSNTTTLSLSMLLTLFLSSSSLSAYGFTTPSTFGVPQSQRRTISQRRRSSSSSTNPSLQMSLVNEVLNGYSSFMTNYPLATQSLTAGALSGVGDSLAQISENGASEEEDKDSVLETDEITNTNFAVAAATIVDEESQQQENHGNEFSFDPERTGRFVLKGLGGGLIWSQWYGIADGWSAILCQDVLSSFELLSGTQTAVRTAISIGLEQFIACPIVYALWDIPLPTYLSGVPAKEVPHQVKNKLGGLLVENAKVWTFVNALIYNIPLEWRVLAVSTADIFWQAVVSSVTSKDISEEAEGQTA